MRSRIPFSLLNYVRPIIVRVVFLFLGVRGLNAQTTLEPTWESAANSRLKAIYERGELKANGIQAEWLPDSSGYVIREHDPETNKQVFVKYDLRNGQRKEQPTQTMNHNRLESPDGKLVLEYRKGNLSVRNTDNNERTLLLKAPSGKDVSYRNFAWSPDGKQVLFVESDATNVRQRNVLVPTDPTYPGVDQHRFARVGEIIAQLRVGVVDVATQQTEWLPIEMPEEGGYLGQVEWAGNSAEILVEKMSRFRDQREFQLVPIGGQARQIYHEKNDAWAIGSQQISSGLNWINDGKQFVVVTEKDGWRHAFLYSRDGKELSLLTAGEYDIIERAVIDEEGGWYYFYASPENATQKYLYRVPLAGTQTLERITPTDQPGTHDYDFSPDAKWGFHTYSRIDSPPVVELIELKGHRRVRVLEDNSPVNKKMQQLIVHPTEFLQLDIGEGVTMDAWMIKPRDFDATKKYPLFIYVYGEPYLQTVLDRWGAAQNHFHRVIADMGYIVVSIDNRGTPAPKGAAWRRSIFGSLGPLSTEDQAAGLKELGRQYSFIDQSRVGIWGWSGGGSNTLNAMFRQPDLYHVGIAVVPKPQPHLYNAWFQEIYMRTREVNAEGYQRSAPINFADGLRGKLLMITGSGETNTHIQIIEGLVDRLIQLEKPFDYMVYPNRDHGLREGPGSELHVRMLITRYLIEHLPRGPR